MNSLFGLHIIFLNDVSFKWYVSTSTLKLDEHIFTNKINSVKTIYENDHRISEVALTHSK